MEKTRDIDEVVSGGSETVVEWLCKVCMVARKSCVSHDWTKAKNVLRVEGSRNAYKISIGICLLSTFCKVCRKN